MTVFVSDNSLGKAMCGTGCKLPSKLAFFFLETWYESLASGITNCKVMVPEVVREPIKIYMTYIFFEITPLRIDRPNFALSK